jgi:hypothetical protein
MKYYHTEYLNSNNRVCDVRKLCAEHMVDMFTCMKEEHLKYRCQASIHRAVDNKDLDCHLGPDSIGLKGWASEQFADLFALCHEYGRPSRFITVTANQNWPEIYEHLYPGQNPSDQPGVVARALKTHIH